MVQNTTTGRPRWGQSETDGTHRQCAQKAQKVEGGGVFTITNTRHKSNNLVSVTCPFNEISFTLMLARHVTYVCYRCILYCTF